VALAAAAYAALLPTGLRPSAQVQPQQPEARAEVELVPVSTQERSEAVPAVTSRTEAPSPQSAAAAPPSPAEEAVRIAALSSSGAPDVELCRPSASAAYCIYTVREGDTLSGIAELLGLTGGEIPGWELLAASNKPDITSVDDFILPGQNLRIPTSRGIVHTTVLDETVGDLAEFFDVTSAEIIEVNSLGSGNFISIGQVLLITDPKRTAPPPAAAAAAGAGPAQAAARAFGFTWPLQTSIRVTQYMTPRHPLGIDMGLSHDPTALVYAVEDGTVSFAGGDRCCSYGLYIIVDHGNGLKTLYAHLSRIDVSQGQRVSQDQALGQSGNTGYSFGVHLHFEVHLNGKNVDPMTYLP